MSKLFGNVQDEWNEMPEFVQPKQEPYAKIIVRFETEQDLKDFSVLVNQMLTKKTKSMWYPELVRGKNASKRYI